MTKLKSKPDGYNDITIELDKLDVILAESKATYDEREETITNALGHFNMNQENDGGGREMGTLYVSDLDGTLLRSDERTSDYTNEQWLEIMPLQASKSNAIKQLQAFLNCEKLIVFEDGS